MVFPYVPPSLNMCCSPVMGLLVTSYFVTRCLISLAALFSLEIVLSELCDVNVFKFS